MPMQAGRTEVVARRRTDTPEGSGRDHLECKRLVVETQGERSTALNAVLDGVAAPRAAP
jgi:hypothetical protein